MKLPLLLLACVIALGIFLEFKSVENNEQKLTGVSLEAPRDSISIESLLPIRQINAKWVAIIPYAFINPENGEVRYNYNQRWWGEGVSGSTETIKMAQQMGMRIMLKPHVWVRGQGWAGDFNPSEERTIDLWEKSYRKYILEYAEVAECTNVELFCIGTEFRKMVVSNPDFWVNLIQDVREIYSGKITYAANWDNYMNVGFWPYLDYIGIDAYFPVSDKKTPEVKQTLARLATVSNSLQKFSNTYNKKVLFTEYGYQSIDYTAVGHWKLSSDTLSVNLQGQANAYEAFYKGLWDKNWCAGGFLWKWHVDHDKYGGLDCKRYTPQNKPSQAVIAAKYKSLTD